MLLDGQYRALDLTDVSGAFCGKMLAELGVDVVKLEPPEGSAERRLSPFVEGHADPDSSLYWLGFNAGKRGVTLNLTSEDGRDIFRRMATKADFVIESFAPGYLERLGLGYRELSVLNPRLVVTSITPYGQDGPTAAAVADDLAIMASSGMLLMHGDVDRAPLQFAVEQAYPQAGAQAAAATMIAHHYRCSTGLGQHVDVSMQEAMAPISGLQYQFWLYQKRITSREGTMGRRGDTACKMIFPCKDGYVAWRIFVAAQGAKTRALTDWMTEEGMGKQVCTVNWEGLDMSKLTQREIDAWEREFTSFFLKHSKRELHLAAIRRGIMLFPMNDSLDLLHDKQLAERDFWADVEHPALGLLIRMPKPPYHLVPQLEWPIRPAPRLGEHNKEIYCDEFGLSSVDLLVLKQAGVI